MSDATSGESGPVRLGEQTAAAIAARLVDLEWTQADLAREMGLTAKHINQIMTGKATGSPRLLDLIAWGMGCRWQVTLVPVDVFSGGSRTQASDAGAHDATSGKARQ